MAPVAIISVCFFLLVQSGSGQTAVHEARAREVLKQGTEDDDPAVRREVALAVGLLSHKDPSVSLLRNLFTDGDVQVRIAAIGSSADLQDVTAIPLLKEKLEDPVPEVAFAAAKALWSFHQPTGKEALLSVLEGETDARSNYFRRKYRGLRRAFSTPKGALLFALNQGMGFVPIPGIGEGFSALQSLFSDSDFSPRASVALMLARERDDATREALLRALGDDSWPVRAAAAQAIAMRNQASLRLKLLPLFEDGNSKVRYRAAAAFLRLARISSDASPRPVRTPKASGE
jgi:HEAT repeat protein